MPTRRSLRLRVAVAFATVWVVAAFGVSAVHGSLRLLPLVAIVVLAYLVCVGVSVYVGMLYWDKRSFHWYVGGALLAGLPISLLWLPLGGWMPTGLYLALAGICGSLGYWIVERT